MNIDNITNLCYNGNTMKNIPVFERLKGIRDAFIPPLDPALIEAEKARKDRAQNVARQIGVTVTREEIVTADNERKATVLAAVMEGERRKVQAAEIGAIALEGLTDDRAAETPITPVEHR